MIDKRFVFSGHAIGAAAHFHRLDEVENLNHIIPTLGSSVIPAVGGHSRHQVTKFSYDVDQPRKRRLLSVENAEATATGRTINGRFETDVAATVGTLSVLDKLRADLVESRQSASRSADSLFSSIVTSGNKIEGLKLGNVLVTVELDEGPFATCGTKQELANFYTAQTDSYRSANCRRFNTPPDAKAIQPYGERFIGSLVRSIALRGPEVEMASMHVDGYSIQWDGFGLIILGEMIMRDQDRHVTMIRLKMGSDAGGNGSIGETQTNGSTMP